MPCTFRSDVMIARLEEKHLSQADLCNLPRRLILPPGVAYNLVESGVIEKIGKVRIKHSGLVNIYGPGPRYSVLMAWWERKTGKIEFICPVCEKHFFDYRYAKRKFCSLECSGKAKIASTEGISFGEPIIGKCYLKEARAMIEGKHWQGKNKCVKLAGDA